MDTATASSYGRITNGGGGFVRVWTEEPAGAGSCLIRFAAVRPSSESETRFSQLLTACGKLAADEGLKQWWHV